MNMMEPISQKRRKIDNQKESQTDHRHQSINNILNDDVLLEILIRLSDTRSLIQSHVVCKSWFSLIHSDDYYNLKQQQRKLESESYPFTLIFRILERGKERWKPLYEYLSEKSQILHGINSPSSSSSSSLNGSYLGFLPRCGRNVRIWSSFNDLLLLSSTSDLKSFIICNPLTRQWLQLPKLRVIRLNGCLRSGGLVCKPPNKGHAQQLKLDQYNYKVMLIYSTGLIDETSDDGIVDYTAMTFCSKTRKWSKSTFSFRGRYLNLNPGIACNGVLHWVEEKQVTKTVSRIVAFDPFKDANHTKLYRFIDFPLGLLQGRFISSYFKVRLGVVQGRLRLSQLLSYNSDHHVLKVWELNSHDPNIFSWSWTLVHDVKVDIKSNPNFMYVVSFHPNNGNLIFLIRSDSRCLYQYDIREEKIEKVGKFPGDGLRIFPYCLNVAHPLWPTTIP